MNLLNANSKIYVAGSSGMVGSAICRKLIMEGYNFENKKLLVSNKKELNLEVAGDVSKWFKKNNPNIVIIAAAKVGGILANKNYPVNFLLENLKIQNNLIEAS